MVKASRPGNNGKRSRSPEASGLAGWDIVTGASLYVLREERKEVIVKEGRGQQLVIYY